MGEIQRIAGLHPSKSAQESMDEYIDEVFENDPEAAEEALRHAERLLEEKLESAVQDHTAKEVKRYLNPVSGLDSLYTTVVDECPLLLENGLDLVIGKKTGCYPTTLNSMSMLTTTPLLIEHQKQLKRCCASSSTVWKAGSIH